MALIVENGTQVTSANSYVSTAFADAYHLARSNTTWAAISTTAAKEALIIKAMDYLELRYFGRWAGTKVASTQALTWPRSYVPKSDMPGGVLAYYAVTDIPPALQNAVCELALKNLSSALIVDPEKETQSEEVGSVKVEYAPGAVSTKRYPMVDLLLKPFLVGGGTHEVIRT